MDYLLDSNTFIEASNRYYSFSICPGYWNWLKEAYQGGKVASIDFIRSELTTPQKSDRTKLDEWMADNSDFFLSTENEQIQSYFMQIVEYVAALPDLIPGARENFLGGSEPWLIASAKAHNACLVTQEQPNPLAKRRILTPNIAKVFDVECTDTFSLLNSFEVNFSN